MASFFAELVEGFSADYALKPAEFKQAESIKEKKISYGRVSELVSQFEGLKGKSGKSSGSTSSPTGDLAQHPTIGATAVLQLREQESSSCTESASSTAIAPITGNISSSSSSSGEEQGTSAWGPSSRGAENGAAYHAQVHLQRRRAPTTAEQEGDNPFLDFASGLFNSLVSGDFEWTDGGSSSNANRRQSRPPEQHHDQGSALFTRVATSDEPMTHTSAPAPHPDPLRAQGLFPMPPERQPVAQEEPDDIAHPGGAPEHLQSPKLSHSSSSSAATPPRTDAMIASPAAGRATSTTFSPDPPPSSNKKLLSSAPAPPSNSQFAAVMRIEREWYEKGDEEINATCSSGADDGVTGSSQNRVSGSSSTNTDIDARLEKFLARFADYQTEIVKLPSAASSSADVGSRGGLVTDHRATTAPAANTYRIRGRDVVLHWNTDSYFLEVIDGPMRQNLEDYLVTGDVSTARYDELSPLKKLNKFTDASSSAKKQFSFNDHECSYNRIEAMRVAKEQAKLRAKMSASNSYTGESGLGGSISTSSVQAFSRYRKWHEAALKKEAPIDAYGNRVEQSTGLSSYFGSMFQSDAGSSMVTERETGIERQGTEVNTDPVMYTPPVMLNPLGSYAAL
ncbi:unnamed protein product [Amoebophrya sp. A120]|nr:unnamed protein product [Amoebophrya sp. A120]|eukprot:GSA120T00021362001.1